MLFRDSYWLFCLSWFYCCCWCVSLRSVNVFLNEYMDIDMEVMCALYTPAVSFHCLFDGLCSWSSAKSLLVEVTYLWTGGHHDIHSLTQVYHIKHALKIGYCHLWLIKLVVTTLSVCTSFGVLLLMFILLLMLEEKFSWYTGIYTLIVIQSLGDDNNNNNNKRVTLNMTSSQKLQDRVTVWK